VVRALSTVFSDSLPDKLSGVAGVFSRMFVIICNFITSVICRLGRQRVIWFTSAGQFVFGIAVAFTFDYYSFMIVRFLLAMVRQEGQLFLCLISYPFSGKPPFCCSYFLPYFTILKPPLLHLFQQSRESLNVLGPQHFSSLN